MNVVWTSWLMFIVVSFAIFEGYALKKGRKTLSRFIYDVSKAWPLLPVLFGFLAGALAVHFWWHWCPPGSATGG